MEGIEYVRAELVDIANSLKVNDWDTEISIWGLGTVLAVHKDELLELVKVIDEIQ